MQPEVITQDTGATRGSRAESNDYPGLLTVLEGAARPGAPATVRLETDHELWVYAPGYWYGYPGMAREEMNGYQYVEWTRDEYGRCDYELSRAEALALVEG